MLMKKGKKLALDEKAISTSEELPAFIAKPAGKPAYYGFQLLKETHTEGWTYGIINEHISERGCGYGDGFVEAPDGSRAGIIWQVGDMETVTVIPPEANRWGVYSMGFPKVIYTMEDLIFCFKTILPELKRLYSEAAKK